jgi:ABC-type phosphate transport system substrate-binding protein
MEIRMIRILPASALLLALFWHTLPSPLHGEEPPRKIIVAGAQSIAPLAEKFTARFRNNHPGVEVEIRGANSNYAIDAVRRGEIHIGLVARSLSAAEKAFSLRANKDKILRTIKRVRGSLGYGIVRVEEAQAQGVKILAVDGRLPTAANLREGLYHFARPQLVIANAGANSIIREWMGEFVKFAQRAPDSEAPR